MCSDGYVSLEVSYLEVKIWNRTYDKVECCQCCVIIQGAKSSTKPSADGKLGMGHRRQCRPLFLREFIMHEF